MSQIYSKLYILSAGLLLYLGLLMNLGCASMNANVHRAPKQVTITSEPSGAAVYVNGGKYIGKTPTNCMATAAAPLKIRVEKPGYKTTHLEAGELRGTEISFLICLMEIPIFPLMIYDAANADELRWYKLPAVAHITLAPQNPKRGELNELFLSGRISEEEYEALGIQETFSNNSE